MKQSVICILLGAACVGVGFFSGRQTVLNSIDIISSEDTLQCTNDLVTHTTMLTNVIAQQLEFEKGVANESANRKAGH